MQEVLHQNVYCPTIKDYKKHNCVDPPKKEIVRDELISLIERNMQRLDFNQQRRFQRLLQWLREFSSNKDWLLEVMATLTNWDHPFFAPNFVAPKRARQTLVDNPNGFFNDLPVKDRYKGKKGRNVVQSKREKHEERLAAIDEQFQALQKRKQSLIEKERERVRHVWDNQVPRAPTVLTPNENPEESKDDSHYGAKNVDMGTPNYISTE